MGLNPDSCDTEARALRSVRPNLLVLPTSRGDVLEESGRAFDLATEEGRRAFVAQLGLREKGAVDVAEVLRRVTAGGRANVARLAGAWSVAERGGTIPSRLVLSGHSTGAYVSGGGSFLAYGAVRALARAMPLAANQVQHVHLSGCFGSGNARHSEAWLTAFPALKSLWAYEGFAPASPVQHLVAWERATRDKAVGLFPMPWLREQGVACWSRTHGFVEASESLQALERTKRAADERFESLCAGVPRMAKPTDEPGASFYRAYRALSNRRDRPDAGELARRADKLLAVRSYETIVRERFADTYGVEIRRGYEALGLEPPNFAQLTRAEALQASERFRTALSTASTASSAALELARILEGLDALDRTVIKPEWSTHAV